MDFESLWLDKQICQKFSTFDGWILQNYLGTQNKPGIPHEFIYKGKYADEIHKECLKLAEHLHIPANEAQQLKKVIGFFCEREECRFEVEWMGIIEMLIPFLNSLDFVYNAFYAITTKYLPRYP